MQPGHTELISPSSRTAARRYIGNSRSQLAHRRIQGTGHLQHWLIRLRFYSADMLSLRRRGVAQVVAHQSGGLGVAGSSPVSPTSIEQCRIFGGCCTARPTLSRLSDAHDSELTDHPCQGRTASRGLSRAPSDPLRRLVADYLRSCRARGLAPKTVESAYAYPLRSVFLPWAARAGLDRLESVTPRALEALAAELLDPERAQGRGPRSRYTVHSYLRAVNQCLRWGRQEGEPSPTAPPPPSAPGPRTAPGSGAERHRSP